MKEMIIKGRKIVGGKVQGHALVSKDPICFLKTIDLYGRVVEEGHALQGKSVTGNILVYPTGKGSTAGSYKLYQMALDGTAPKAIINNKADSVTISGAFLGNIPMMHRFDINPTEVIQTGDEVTVDADTGTINIVKE